MLFLWQNLFAGDDLKFYPSQNEKGLYLLVPGLNFAPEGYRQLRDDLVARGFSVYVLHLKYTHEADRKWEGDEDLASHWLSQTLSAFEEMDQTAELKGLSWSLLSYSLGGLVSEIILGEELQFDRLKAITYLSPAFDVRWYIYISLQAAHALPDSLEFPSWNLESYQTRDFTYVGEYVAFLDLMSLFSGRSELFLNIPTVFYMSEHDELLDFEDTKLYLEETRANLKIHMVKDTKTNKIGKYHLVVDEASLGKEDYTKLLNQLTRSN